MKTNFIALAAAAFAVIATPASATNISIQAPTPVTSQSSINTAATSNSVQASVDTSELRGRRGFRRGRGGFRQRGFRKGFRGGIHGGKFKHRNRGFIAKKKLHHKHNDHFIHDDGFHHKKFKGKHLKHKSVKHFKY
ncbi:MAG: hypothetical protein AAF250_12405 [Pseudomonadota bacterium]